LTEPYVTDVKTKIAEAYGIHGWKELDATTNNATVSSKGSLYDNDGLKNEDFYGWERQSCVPVMEKLLQQRTTYPTT
jgi:hypothetical protein